MKGILKNRVFIYISIALLSACSQTEKRNPEITSNELYTHMTYLASDDLKGRYPGSDGSQLAGNYIHQALSDYGLTPMHDNGYQKFDVVTGCSLGTGNILQINTDTLKLEKDYIPLSFTANAACEGNVVFIGYGFEIETNNLNWNDYAMVDVEDKWVMVLRDDPEPDNMDSDFIVFANDRAKATLAKDKGAIGILLVNGVHSEKEDVLVPLNYDQNLSDAGIPVINITREVANQILNGSGTIEEFEQSIIENKKSLILRSNTMIKAKTEIIQNIKEARNVVFKITPNTQSKQYLVIGAHYDHLGMGGEGVSSRMPDTVAVHNGADDNASGVSGLIELAGFLSSKKDSLKKNIVFVAFDAEEMGVLGSKYNIENLPFKKNQIMAMLNFDMIGRLKHDTIGITLGGTGTAAEFDSILNTMKPKFRVQQNPDGYGPSDHAPYYSENIPVLFFSTGAHEDYHTPFDDIEKIDTAKQVDVLQYASNIIMQLACHTDTLTFQSTGSAASPGRRTKLKVTFGIIPDFSGIHKNGLGVDGVRKDGPAAKGGMQKGDKITAINGDSVTNIYDYMLRLQKLKPQTTAIVEVERNKKKEVLLIQL